jgi:hypothetical protein
MRRPISASVRTADEATRHTDEMLHASMAEFGSVVEGDRIIWPPWWWT